MKIEDEIVRGLLMKHHYELSEKEQADLDAFSYYHELEEYINDRNGRFFFGGSESSGSNFFSELERLLPHLTREIPSDKTYYRARVVNCHTRNYSCPDSKFEAYSQKELAAPPPEIAKEGRSNPKGVSYLYLADTRRCALAEIRPTISSLVAIAEGVLHRDASIVSFVTASWQGISLFEKSMVEMLGGLYSDPLNNQDSNEYIPSQAIAEFIKRKGFDGIEYRSAQYKAGTSLTLFDTTLWHAELAKTFEVTDIEYIAVRNRGLVEAFGYGDEEL